MSRNTFSGVPKRLVTKEFIVPFILVTSLFFLWGVAHSLLDVLNKHFQDILGITRARSGLVQAALYGGYFIMAIPAGLFMNRLGYRKGIITGLLLYAAGAFLFLPATYIQTFEFTLFSLFVISYKWAERSQTAKRSEFKGLDIGGGKNRNTPAA